MRPAYDGIEPVEHLEGGIPPVQLRADCSALTVELERALTEASLEVAPEAINAFLEGSFDLVPDVIGQEYDAATRTLWLRFQLPERFREALAALRAGEVDGNVTIN